MGAKSKADKWLKKENLIRLEGWRRDGLTHEQIAHNMSINPVTLYRYINVYKEIAEALKKGEECCTYEVENAMYKSAMGYEVTETELTEIKDANGDTVQKVLRQRKRHVPPSTAAQIFILKNRRSERWKDARTIEAKNDGQLAALIDGLKEPVLKEDDAE